VTHRPPIQTRVSFVGGFGVPYAKVPLAKYQFTWPFAWIDLGDASLALTARGPAGFFLKSIIVPYVTISRAEVKQGRFVGAIRLRIPGSDIDRSGFAGFRRRGFDDAVQLLRERGVEVVPR